jgi:hypothetical protein
MNSISKCKRTSFQKKCKRTKRAQDVVHQKHNSLHVGYIKLGHLSHKHHQSICLVYALYLYHRINSKIVQETMIASQKSSLNAKSNTKIVTEKQNWASFHAITDNIKSEIHVMIANSRRNAQTILSQIPMLLRLWQLFSYRSRWGCQQRRQRKLIKW